MATELFELKTRFDQQEKELKMARREAESRERDFKVPLDTAAQQRTNPHTRRTVTCRNTIPGPDISHFLY